MVETPFYMVDLYSINTGQIIAIYLEPSGDPNCVKMVFPTLNNYDVVGLDLFDYSDLNEDQMKSIRG